MTLNLTGEPHRVAPKLLGARITSTVDGTPVTLRITEVEAYGGIGGDPGSHAHRRRTPRNETMFGRAGLAYVYFTYGMHWCCNIVVGAEGEAAAVLLRAGEVVEGLSVAWARRASAKSEVEIARGPARLCLALGITGDIDGVDLLDPRSPVRLDLDAHRPRRSGIGVSPRTGVAGEGSLIPWRFHLDGEPTVSPYRPAAPRAAR